MKGVGSITGVLVALAVCGLCLPQPLLAAGATAKRAPIVSDVALANGGVLIGQVVNPQGHSIAKVPVSLRDEQREIAKTETDKNGYFAVRGLRGGVYQIVAAEGQGTYRIWTPGSSPPSAQKGALVVAGSETVRGQLGGPLSFWLSNPWVVAGVVATAATVPVAIHNSDRPTSP